MLKRFLFLILAVLGVGLAKNQRIFAEAGPNLPFEMPAEQEILKLKSAVISTSRGDLYCELFPDIAPIHVANFKYRADKGFYRDLSFHLFEPGYIIQGGDLKGTGYGNPGYSIPPEFSRMRHTFGTLGMARMPDQLAANGRPVNPERKSSGSQFHILLGNARHMDGNYTIFGRVVSGINVLRDLRRGDKILDVKVYVVGGKNKEKDEVKERRPVILGE